MTNKQVTIEGKFDGFAFGLRSPHLTPFKNSYDLVWTDCKLDVAPLGITEDNSGKQQKIHIDILSNVEVKLRGKSYLATISDIDILGTITLIRSDDQRIHKVEGIMRGHLLSIPPAADDKRGPNAENWAETFESLKRFLLFFHLLLLSFLVLLDRTQIWTYFVPYAIGLGLFFSQEVLLNALHVSSIRHRSLILLRKGLDRAKPLLLLLQISSLLGVIWHLIFALHFLNYWPYLLVGGLPVALSYISHQTSRRYFFTTALIWTLIFFLLFWITLHPERRTLMGDHALTPNESPQSSSQTASSGMGKGKCVMKKFNVLQSALFDFNKATIKPQGKQVLKGLAQKVLDLKRSNPNVKLELRGHTDHVGTQERNIALSLRRANSVKEALKDYGVNPQDMKTKGMGSEAPISEIDQENRRVDIFVSCEEEK